MDWNDLRYVLAVARAGTLQDAGVALSVSHTTVGRRVKSLEDELGVRLFERTPEGFLPTQAGEDIVAVAESVEREVLAVQGRVRGRDEMLRGKLRVSTVDVIFYCFENAFSSFAARYPAVDLSIETSPAAASLSRGEADVVLRLSNEPPEQLVGRTLGHVQFGVYAGRSLVERMGEDAPLDAFPWIGWDGAKNQSWFEGWLAENAPKAQIALRLDNQALLMAQAVRAGIGAQILPCVLADPDEQLQRIAPLDDTFKLGLWLLTTSALRTNRRVRAFLDHIAAALKPHRRALAGELSNASLTGHVDR